MLLGAEGTGTPTSVTLLVAAIPAFAAVAAAIVAGVYAKRARVAEADTSRLRDLEDRIAAKKYDPYKPMIELLRDMLDSSAMNSVKGKELTKKISDFVIWISIYGSDEAVIAFERFMQGAYHDAPGPVAIRLYAEFVYAARKDLGHATTEITLEQILGMRINDLYDDPKNQEFATLSFEQLAHRENWDIPWTATRGRQ